MTMSSLSKKANLKTQRMDQLKGNHDKTQKDDRLLIKKLKEDDAMAVRSDRQQSELRALNAGTIS